MKSKIVWILLILSLSFNVLFAAGFLKTRSVLREIRTPEGRANLAGKRLGLDESQRAEFKNMQTSIRSKIESFKKDKAPDVETLWSELFKESPDTGTLESILDRSYEGRRDVRLSVLKSLNGFLKTLDPEQKKKFTSMMRRREIDW